MSTSRNSNLATGLLLLDVRKAFDSHKVLVRKLQSLGIGPVMLNWLERYLCRVQVVRYDGNIPKGEKVLSCIPQGSIVGPALFIFYINSLFSKITNVKVKMLADDCVLYGPCYGDWNQW